MAAMARYSSAAIDLDTEDLKNAFGELNNTLKKLPCSLSTLENIKENTIEEDSWRLASAIVRVGEAMVKRNSRSAEVLQKAASCLSSALLLAPDHPIALVSYGRTIEALSDRVGDQPVPWSIAVDRVKKVVAQSDEIGAKWGVSKETVKEAQKEAKDLLLRLNKKLQEDVKKYVKKQYVQEVLEKKKLSPVKYVQRVGEGVIQKTFDGGEAMTLAEAAMHKDIQGKGETRRKVRNLNAIFEEAADTDGQYKNVTWLDAYLVQFRPLVRPSPQRSSQPSSVRAVPPRVPKLSVLSWNIKFSSFRDVKDEEFEEVSEWKASAIADVIERENVDIICIQEVPGSHFLHLGGRNARLSVRNNEFLKLIQSKLEKLFFTFGRKYVATILDSPCLKSMGYGSDELKHAGESTIFVYDQHQFDCKEGPNLLQPCTEDRKAGNGFHRAPPYCKLRPLEGSSLKDVSELMVVSVHMKSGGGAETVADLSLLGRALAELKDMGKEKGKARVRQESGQYVDGNPVLVIGDFNATPERVLAIFKAEKATCFSPCLSGVPTNMWKFNGSASRSDRHEYDSAFIGVTSSTAAVKERHERLDPDIPSLYPKIDSLNVSAESPFIHAFGRLASMPEVDAVYEEMKRVSEAIAPPLDSSALLHMLGSGRGTGENRAIKTTRGEDGVLSYLRQRYQYFINKRLSDHYPIIISISVARK
uniref:Uncharacterized protein n=1 Tax=Palpitomonas bilix TaxID=652834 RepID=A0A7S3GIS5_9EUKA|mmetsp:Transcript_5253/g.11675  ORF Transcript_5253/g.11675 Transcript_5253/m.11675 type:complete len:700 (+) Transcript_5253:255-2354(+)|eukprot:CAMPEP_0113896246 /NCGR_PEP_ID=MMETSP0780_2-20120614/17883_1 /TAXON_ID=652834 /ORGANISM="Palpitomonas bilix" /LENGTH=699 /DNA_ID=CAMNT_0000887309 /DNA_START=43 /DNA_END=2142 /DNA_ORIENTATION=+ /assembly_acc=CAM_ASM_000599